MCQWIMDKMSPSPILSIIQPITQVQFQDFAKEGSQLLRPKVADAANWRHES